MIIVIIFVIIVLSSLVAGFFILSPLMFFNSTSTSFINKEINTLESIKINTDFGDSNIKQKNKQIDFTSDNLNSDLTNEILDDETKKNFGVLSEIEKTKIKNNNLIDSKIVNLNNFALELQLIPLKDFQTFKVFTNDSVKNVIVYMRVYPINGEIKTIKNNGTEIVLDRKNVFGLYSIKQKGLFGLVADASNPDSVNFIDIKDLAEPFYYKDKSISFNKEIDINPFYNLENGTITYNDNYFHKGNIYLIKIYFDIDPSQVENFKLYIPNGNYITLNNIEKVTEIKQGKQYYLNKVKIIKKGLINKINESQYGF